MGGGGNISVKFENCAKTDLFSGGLTDDQDDAAQKEMVGFAMEVFLRGLKIAMKLRTCVPWGKHGEMNMFLELTRIPCRVSHSWVDLC